MLAVRKREHAEIEHEDRVEERRDEQAIRQSEDSAQYNTHKECSHREFEVPPFDAEAPCSIQYVREPEDEGRQEYCRDEVGLHLQEALYESAEYDFLRYSEK